MKNLSTLFSFLLLTIGTIQGCKVEPQYTCDVDTSKAGYELAAEYDDCLVWNAQKTMAHIETKNIDIRATELSEMEFGSAYADINASENWIKPVYT